MHDHLLFINLSSVPEFNDYLLNKSKGSSKLLKLNNVQNKLSNKKYKIISYDKSILSNDLINVYGIYRSIIMNENNNVVSFAPVKSIPYDLFITKYPTKNDDIVALEFVEGTMINVFWDETIGLSGSWEIATRNNVGGNNTYDKNKSTYRTMFLEAAKENNLLLHNLNRMFCYNFVLQHPENGLVIPIQNKKLYLICITHISNRENNIIVYPSYIDDSQQLNWLNTTIQFPKKYKWNNYEELIDTYASTNTEYHIMGVVLYNNKTGERTKVRNPVYEEIKSMYGNKPNIQYQYLLLRKLGQVSVFLHYYPEWKRLFSVYRDQIHSFTRSLHRLYVDCYIKKEKKLVDVSNQFTKHIGEIHNLYRTHYKTNNKTIQENSVIQYVNSLEPDVLMYTLHYSLRKRMTDIITKKMM
jgi:hypothetical protein